MQALRAFNFRDWIERHRDVLKPPVCNRQIFDESEFIVMVVGGPNSRDDYHDDPGEELFYQIEGDMVLRTIRDGNRSDLRIGEGEMLLLPAHVPHSPQRFADTVGLVIERRRGPDERDGFLWYCDNCDRRLHAEYLHVGNIETDLPPVFERFYDDPAKRRCRHCGHVAERPDGK